MAGELEPIVMVPGLSLSDLWIPRALSAHAAAIDALFYWIFGITTVLFLIVQITLVVFLLRYRRRRGIEGRAHHTHGSPLLEIAWTATPALILGLLAWRSTIAWDAYRYNDTPPAERSKVMVIAEQFKWNFVYPGPDGEFGQYLSYPNLTDPKYRHLRADSRHELRESAIRAINNDIDENPLGRVKTPRPPGAGDDWTDPGADDDWEKYPIRPLVVPVDTTIEVLLKSKDVIHDFFLPDFRVKLDAVPGTTGHLFFKPLPDSQSTIPTDLDSIAASDRLWIDRDTPTATVDAYGNAYLADPKDANSRIGRLEPLSRLCQNRLDALKIKASTPADATRLIAEQLTALKADLRAAGITKLSVIHPHPIICEKFCGIGHSTMHSELIVLSKRQYHNFTYKNGTLPEPGNATGAPQ